MPAPSAAQPDATSRSSGTKQRSPSQKPTSPGGSTNATAWSALGGVSKRQLAGSKLGSGETPSKHARTSRHALAPAPSSPKNPGASKIGSLLNSTSVGSHCPATQVLPEGHGNGAALSPTRPSPAASSFDATPPAPPLPPDSAAVGATQSQSMVAGRRRRLAAPSAFGVCPAALSVPCGVFAKARSPLRGSCACAVT